MQMVSSSGRTPHYSRLMIFVDGTNFLVELSKELDIRFRAEKPPLASLHIAKDFILNATGICKRWPADFITIRQFWFASYVGDDGDYKKLRNALRDIEFEPVLFKKEKSKPEKGLDIALTKEMLVNAFNGNFDIAMLVAGDEDYVGLVNEVKRFGPVVNGAFFKHGLSDNLRYAFDNFMIFPENMISEEYRKIWVSKILEEIKARSVSKNGEV